MGNWREVGRVWINRGCDEDGCDCLYLACYDDFLCISFRIRRSGEFYGWREILFVIYRVLELEILPHIHIHTHIIYACHAMSCHIISNSHIKFIHFAYVYFPSSPSPSSPSPSSKPNFESKIYIQWKTLLSHPSIYPSIHNSIPLPYTDPPLLIPQPTN